MKNSVGIYDILYCSNLDYKQRIDIYKKAGFKQFALYLDDDYMQGEEKYIDVFNYTKKVGMTISQVHLDYKIANLICDGSTNTYFDYLTKKAKECTNLGVKHMVLHASRGDKPPIINKEQLEKLKNVAKNFKNVVFCFENVRKNENLDAVLSCNLPNVKMCYDLGHAHAYGNELEMFNKYKNKITCSHLHNNFGTDEHRPLFDGEIDYKQIVDELVKIKGCSNCLECFPPKGEKLNKEEFEEFVKKCFKSIG